MNKNENNMDSSNTSSRIPKLRFPGFTGEWEEKKLGEVTTWDKYFQGVPKQLQSRVIKYPYVLANVFSDIERKGGNVLLLSTGNYVGWTTEELAGNNLCEGEVVAIPWGGTANIKYVKGKFVTADNRIATSSDLTVLNNKFLYYYMLCNKETIDGFYRGAGLKHPSMFDVLNMPIILPTISEQQKIASCLSELDNLISAQGQKVDALKEKKKGLMQQLFPQQGETTPRLRFPGFEGEWEEKKLGEVCNLFGRIGYRGYTKEDLVAKGEGAITFSPSDIIDQSIDYSDCDYISDFKYEESPEIKVYNGDIIFCKTASIGKCALITNLKEKATINPQFVVLKNFKVDNHFLFYTIAGNSFQIKASSITAGSTIKTMSQEQLKLLTIYLPSLPEQQKIASCLSALDETITAEAEKLEALKNHKKGLMQQLFPQPAK